MAARAQELLDFNLPTQPLAEIEKGLRRLRQFPVTFAAHVQRKLGLLRTHTISNSLTLEPARVFNLETWFSSRFG
jgi:hypothetical protein